MLALSGLVVSSGAECIEDASRRRRSRGRNSSSEGLQVMGFSGLQRVEQEEAFAGDIVSVSGIEGYPSRTICDPEAAEALPA